jgi:DNA-binding transcriptional regulator YdaS (Cro superfamily)
MTLLEHLRAERGRAVQVASRCGLTPAFLSQIARGVRPAPAERCFAIERATQGAVRRWDLRPLDWHHIWPELIGLDGAPRPIDDTPVPCGPA